MSAIELLLYTRKGCCLCESLEDRLKGICLKDFYPELFFSIKDIDSKNVSEIEKQSYSLEVPVLVLFVKETGLKFKLPRVSPRLKNEGFYNWLEKVIKEKITKT